LQEAKVRCTGPALLEYLRSRIPEPARLEKARALVKKLGDDAFAVREKATADLTALGPVALPLLRMAAKDKDPEVSRRAVQCLQQIGEEGSKNAVAAAVRLAAVRRPEGTAGVLLDLLPGADEALTAEIKAALFALAPDGKPDGVLVRALEDRDPARRGAAAAVLGKDGGAYRKEVRRVYGRLPKWPMKIALYVDGKMQMEMETLEIEFFTRFADKEFARP
jgi:HEAT repeat protein